MLVCNDLLGLDTRFQPRFVKRFASLEAVVQGAVKEYVDEVRAGTFPTDEHSFHQREPRAKLARVY